MRHTMEINFERVRCELMQWGYKREDLKGQHMEDLKQFHREGMQSWLQAYENPSSELQTSAGSNIHNSAAAGNPDEPIGSESP